MGCTIIQPANQVLNPLFFPGLKLWWSAERLDAAGNYTDLSRSSQLGTNTSVTIVPGVANGRTIGRYDGAASKTVTNSFVPFGDFSAFIMIKAPSALAAASFIGFAGVGGQNQVLVANAAENQSCFDNVNHPTSNVFDFHTAFTLCGVVAVGGICAFYRNGVLLNIPAAAVSVGSLTGFGSIGVFFSAFDFAEGVFYTTGLNGFQLPILTEYFRERYNF